MPGLKFTQLRDATREDFQLLKSLAPPERGPTDAILALFESLRGVPADHWPVSVYQHTLQSGTMALRDGADEELVICALLHDLGHEIAPHDHGGFMADLLAPYIDPDNEWILRHHPEFQMQYLEGYFSNPNAHEAYRGHPLFERTLAFVDRWDQAAFDSSYPTLPIEAFEPMLRRVLDAPRADWPERARRRHQGKD
jgi:predicted HD phosphohydrolase